MTAENPSGQKSALRKRMLAERDALTDRQREALSALATEKLLCHSAYVKAACVLAYSSIGSEFNTVAFMGAALRAGKMLVLPVVADKQLMLKQVSDLGTLRTAAFGIAEPDAGSPLIALQDIDFALLPGVAFDRNLNRVGYGGGYYDRLLAESRQRPLLAAAAFSLQLVDAVPVDEHDVQIDLLITEKQQIESAHDGKNH